MFASLRIGILNQLLFGGILLLLAAVLITDVATGIASRAAAMRTVEIARSGQDLFTVLQLVRTERGRVRVGLQGQASVPQSMIDELNKNRQQAAPALERFIATCTRVECATKDQLDGLKSASASLDAGRKEADRDLLLALSSRAAGAADSWTKLSTAVIDRLEALSARLSTDIRMVDPIISELVEIKKASWIVRDQSGLARNIYGEVLQANAITPAQSAKFTDFEARIDNAWNQLADLTSRAGEPASITDVVKAARAEYFNHLKPEFAAIREAAASGKPQPMGVEEMMTSSTAGLAILMKVPEAAIAEIFTYAENRAASATRTVLIESAVFLLALVVGVVGVLAIRGRVVRPIHGIVAAMRVVADGRLDDEIPYRDRADEIGELAAALAVFKENAVEKLRLAVQEQQAQAQREKRQAAIEAAIRDFESAASGLLDAFAEAANRMTSTSASMSETAERTTQQATAVVKASDLTSMNVQTVAGATEELSASIGEISRQVTQSAAIAGRAVDEAKRTDTTVNGLTDAANRIGEVVQIIQDIASQTNLLALNATIEAARAGEAGKGFAVVAGEVKTLASQTSKATGDIAEQIAAIQNVAQEAVTAIRAIGGTIGEISGIATAIASAVEEQGAATSDIAANVQQASQSVQEVTTNIAGVSQAADQTGHAAHDVTVAAADITRQAGDLRNHVASFLERIRSA